MGGITSLVSVNLQDCTDITGESDSPVLSFTLLSFFPLVLSSALFTATGFVVALSSRIHQMLGVSLAKLCCCWIDRRGIQVMGPASAFDQRFNPEWLACE